MLSAELPDAIKQTNNRARLLSVDWPLRLLCVLAATIIEMMGNCGIYSSN